MAEPEPWEDDEPEGPVRKFMYVNRRAPYGTIYAWESLEVVLIGAAFEQDVSLAFLDDGVFQLTKGQDTKGIGMKNFSPTYAALGDYEVTKIYVEKESLEERGLTLDDLQHLVWEDEDEDWAEKDSIRLVSRAELAEVIAILTGVLGRYVYYLIPRSAAGRAMSEHELNESIQEIDGLILDEVQQRSGAKILLALKAFAMWSTFPLIRETLQGVCASSPWEARLGRETFGGEVHSFAAAFKERDIVELLSISDHLVFNSFAQLERFRPLWEQERERVSIGLRVNPEHSEGHTEIYDPCAKNSRLGIPRREFDGKSLAGVDGLHFHTLCEHLFEPLARTAKAFEEKFGEFLPGMKWLNLGGGHHITRAGYDIDRLVALVKYFRDKYDVEELGPELADAFPQFAVGDLLVSMRSLNLIAVLDGSTHDVKWWQIGPWHRQHDPDQADPRHDTDPALGPPRAQVAPGDHPFKRGKGRGGRGLGGGSGHFGSCSGLPQPAVLHSRGQATFQPHGSPGFSIETQPPALYQIAVRCAPSLLKSPHSPVANRRDPHTRFTPPRPPMRKRLPMASSPVANS